MREAPIICNIELVNYYTGNGYEVHVGRGGGGAYQEAITAGVPL